MTKEQIQARLEVLQTERETVKTSLAAYDGAIQDCNYWLTTLTETEALNAATPEETTNV